LKAADDNFFAGCYADATYKAYNAFVHAAKALLLKKDVQVNTQHGIINDFDKHFNLQLLIPVSFKQLVTQISTNKPEKAFTIKYINEAHLFLSHIPELEKQIELNINPILN